MGNRIITGLLGLLLLCQCTNQENEDNSQDNSINIGELIIVPGTCIPDVADKYVYPIVPGTEKWNNLGSEEEAIKACQLPDNVLKKISTLGLIRSFLDVPITFGFYHLYSVSCPISRINGIYSYNNSVKELLNRKDSGEALLLFFDALCFDCLETMDVTRRMYFSIQLAALEVFFAQQEILNQLDHENRQKVVAMLLTMYEQMQIINFDGFMDHASIYVIARVMYLSNYKPIIDLFGSKDKLCYSSERVENIILYAKNFIR